MAEEILVKEPLTHEMIAAGEELMRVLEAANIELSALFWLYTVEAGQWRLTLATPLVDTLGPKKTYATVRNALSSASSAIQGLDLLSVTAVSPNERLVRALASVSGLANSSLATKRLPRSYLNGIYVDDIYIYFVKDSVKPLPGKSFYLGDKELS